MKTKTTYPTPVIRAAWRRIKHPTMRTMMVISTMIKLGNARMIEQGRRAR